MVNLATPQMTTKVFMVKKISFKISKLVKKILEEVGVSLSPSNNKRRLHEWKYRAFRTKCKPLVTLQKF